ncbi:MAG TPA: valine--tRNA ligase [Myxococcota bacterium]|nr:valine--tRNA ligase [Myxococcota bacterium]
MNAELPNHFDPKDAYERYYRWWESNGYFVADPAAPGEAFSIVIPPPNVTGSLHMGHALNNSLQDVLIRYKRMDGYNVLWVPGVDHAGIATQWVVERQLRAEGKTRQELGRQAFEERVWSWKAQSGGTIIGQLRRLGVSCDWSRERFTLDPALSKAVREFFVTLYDEGLIYRATRLINWDPIGMTALSDLEVSSTEETGELWSFAYPLSDGSGEIVVATTRPETMLGDTAVAVHPEDPRYKELIGKTVRHPLLEREIPIIGDAILVDPAFGSGAVKVTPAHDFNDHEVGKRHSLPMITIFDKAGKVNEHGGSYQGMDRFDARKKVKADIEALGLDRGAKPHTLMLPRSQRSGAVVEPMISTQWFVKMKPLSTPAIAAVQNDFTRFWPKQWENVYFSWLKDIKDWCISRQLWWGHRIPAWHCEACGEISVSRDDLQACSACGSAQIRQDEDVLDTWFSSALWPFSTMGWPDRTEDLRRYYPTSVLLTGFDIIFFWVARMMFAGTHLTGAVPFRDVYIHGLVRDEAGEKMSKTKGNVVDPLEALDKHGVDAVRLTLVALSGLGRDVLWSPKRVETYEKFQNKVWQAFRFLKLHVKDVPLKPENISDLDRWILARTGTAVARVRAALDGYRFNDAASELHAFIWYELCDWYLEFSKGALYGEDEEAKAAARWTLWTVFQAVARLLHPFMPFLSEEIWQHLPGSSGSVMKAAFPKAADFPEDARALDEVAALQECITALRKVRADMGIPKGPLRLVVNEELAGRLGRYQKALGNLAGTSLETGSRPHPAATLVVAGQECWVPLEGLVDLDKERARLGKEIEKTKKSVDFYASRLNNPGFVSRSPAELVEENRQKMAEDQDRLAKLQAALAALA